MNLKLAIKRQFKGGGSIVPGLKGIGVAFI